MEAWARKFGVSLEQEDVRTVAAFMASGIVGVLGEQEGQPCDERFDARLQTISEVFSAPAMAFARSFEAKRCCKALIPRGNRPNLQHSLRMGGEESIHGVCHKQ